MEKIVSEFKIIETDDGFRIEIKGDKEALRKMFSHARRQRGPFGRRFPFWGGLGHWCAPSEEPEVEEERGA